ncbi:MAG: hypothetical protein IJB77_03990, partial [Bacteroidaceae bacterium]|nr:hypothetical protein [Bacteroidaceae bacterium]
SLVCFARVVVQTPSPCGYSLLAKRESFSFLLLLDKRRWIQLAEDGGVECFACVFVQTPTPFGDSLFKRENIVI